MNILEQIAYEKSDKIPTTDKIYRRLVQEILTGKIKPNSKLTENQICTKYKVSRTPVREAFRQLEMHSLIEYVPNRGVFVKGLNDQEVEDIFQLRRDCEVKAVRWATERIEKKEKEELEEIFAYMEFYTMKKDVKKMIDINLGFHRVIYKATHNDFLYDTLTTYQTYTHYARPSNYFVHNYLNKVLDEHTVIYNAILNSQPELAARAMKIHMDNALKRRL